jgi:hypothetical protein
MTAEICSALSGCWTITETGRNAHGVHIRQRGYRQEGQLAVMNTRA